MDTRTAITAVCAAVLLFAAVGGATAMGVAASDAVEPGDRSVAAGETADPAGSDDAVERDGAFEDVEGTVEVVVQFEETTAATPDALQAHAEAIRQPFETFAEATPGVTVESRLWLTPAALVTVDTDRVSLDRLVAVDGVETLFENAEMTTGTGSVTDGAQTSAAAQGASAVGSELATPETNGFSTANYDTTYGLAEINATEVWDAYGTQGEGASVAVLDTGVDADHPDIDLTKWAEFDGSGNEVDSQPQDYGSHGTHVSGTVTGGNSSGTHIGVAPGADLYHAAVLTDCGSGGCSGTFAQIIAGMQWAVDQNVDVMSMSLGAQGYYDSFIDPVRNAQAAGTTVVTSSGNSGEGTSGSPGNVYDAISVGASNSSGGIASFSSGEEITTDSAWSSPPAEWPDTYIVPTIAAPGAAVNSAVPGGGYENKWGTSMAAPHVSGALALAESALSRSVSPAEFGTALEATATKPADAPAPPGERDTRYGSGIIDVPAVIDYLQSPADYQLSNLTPAADSVVAGTGSIDISVDVTNAGASAGQQDLSLVVTDDETGGEAYAETVAGVEVAGGETQTVTFQGVPAGEFAPGNYTHSVTSANDSVAGSLAVLAPASFTVAIGSATTPVEGENLSVTVQVENVGDIEGTETVTLSAGTLGETETNVTLAGGATTTVTLNLSTAAGDAGEYTATVSSANDTANTTVVVDAPAASVLSGLDIAGSGGNTTLIEGTAANVSVVVENAGDRSGSFDVTLSVGSAVTRTQTTGDLTAGGTETVTFENVTGGLDPGAYSVTASTANDTAGGDLTVDPAYGVQFPDQNASEQSEAVVEGVFSDGEVVMFVTHDDGGDDIVAGMTNGTFGDENVTVLLEAAIGFPAEYTVRLVPAAEVSGSYQPGDTLSANTSEAAVATANATVTTFNGAPEIDINDEGPAKDTTGDGMLNDVDGTGSFTIFDVQALFDNRDTETFTEHAEHFNFQGTNPDEVTIFDVQSLFLQYQDS